MTAALAELSAAALLAARRAQTGGLVPVVDAAGPVLRLDLLVRLADLRGPLHARDLLFALRRARRAQPALAVPADLPAHPLATAVALLEVRLHFFHGLGQRLVAGRPAYP